jgi:hypothetical protein
MRNKSQRKRWYAGYKHEEKHRQDRANHYKDFLGRVERGEISKEAMDNWFKKYDGLDGDAKDTTSADMRGQSSNVDLNSQAPASSSSAPESVPPPRSNARQTQGMTAGGNTTEPITGAALASSPGFVSNTVTSKNKGKGKQAFVEDAIENDEDDGAPSASMFARTSVFAEAIDPILDKGKGKETFVEEAVEREDEYDEAPSTSVFAGTRAFAEASKPILDTVGDFGDEDELLDKHTMDQPQLSNKGKTKRYLGMEDAASDAFSQNIQELIAFVQTLPDFPVEVTDQQPDQQPTDNSAYQDGSTSSTIVPRGPVMKVASSRKVSESLFKTMARAKIESQRARGEIPIREARAMESTGEAIKNSQRDTASLEDITGGPSDSNANRNALGQMVWPPALAIPASPELGGLSEINKFLSYATDEAS